MDNKKKFRDYCGLHKVEGTVGIEIEMEGTGLSLINHNMLAGGFMGWDLKSDGSLRGESCEWVLVKPLNMLDSFQALDILYDSCSRSKGAKFEPSRRCGVHIHINVQEMTRKQIFNFICLYMLFENVLLRWASQEREGNFFCLRATDARYLSAQLSRIWDSADFSEVPNDNLRYAAINIGALFKFGSLEFRSLPTPAYSPARIKTWIRLLLSLRIYSMSLKTPREIITQYSAVGPESYIDQVFGPGSPLLTVGGLRQMTKQGMRNVQDILMLKPMPVHYVDSIQTSWYVGGNQPMYPSDDLLEEMPYYGDEEL